MLISSTDANGRQSQRSYETSTLRRVSTTLPTGAHADFAYDDAGMSLTQTTYLAPAEGSGVGAAPRKVVHYFALDAHSEWLWW